MENSEEKRMGKVLVETIVADGIKWKMSKNWLR